MAYKRILVSLDGTPLPEAALPHAKSLAQCLGMELVLLRVMDNPVAEFVFSHPNLSETTTRKIETKVHEYIKALGASLEPEGLRDSHLIQSGPVAENILEVSDAMQWI